MLRYRMTLNLSLWPYGPTAYQETDRLRPLRSWSGPGIGMLMHTLTNHRTKPLPFIRLSYRVALITLKIPNAENWSESETESESKAQILWLAARESEPESQAHGSND